MMEAERTSEKSADNYFTRQYIPEDKSEFHTRRRENLKSHTGIWNLKVMIFLSKLLSQDTTRHILFRISSVHNTLLFHSLPLI
jgi:hypothetical protein